MLVEDKDFEQAWRDRFFNDHDSNYHVAIVGAVKPVSEEILKTLKSIRDLPAEYQVNEVHNQYHRWLRELFVKNLTVATESLDFVDFLQASYYYEHIRCIKQQKKVEVEAAAKTPCPVTHDPIRPSGNVFSYPVVIFSMDKVEKFVRKRVSSVQDDDPVLLTPHLNEQLEFLLAPLSGRGFLGNKEAADDTHGLNRSVFHQLIGRINEIDLFSYRFMGRVKPGECPKEVFIKGILTVVQRVVDVFEAWRHVTLNRDKLTVSGFLPFLMSYNYLPNNQFLLDLSTLIGCGDV